MTNPNFSQLLGIHSVAAAVVFLALYIPLFLFWLVQVFRGFSFVMLMLALFCQVRLVSFVLRTVLAASTSAGENQSLLIADFVLFNAGFAWVLYCAYSTTVDRLFLDSDRSSQSGIFFRSLATSRYLVKGAMSGAVALSAIGGVNSVSSNPSTRSNAINFRRGSIYIYLAVVVALAIVVVRLFFARSKKAYVRTPVTQRDTALPSSEGVGARYDAIILSAITVLFLVREGFYAATGGNFVRQNKEVLWYPLAVATEYLSLCLLAAPGLVPSREQLRAVSRIQNMDSKS